MVLAESQVVELVEAVVVQARMVRMAVLVDAAKLGCGFTDERNN